MSTLQEQQDALNDIPSDDPLTAERAIEDALGGGEEPEPEYVDDVDADDYPAPEPLESDGGSRKSQTADFADTTPEGGVHDSSGDVSQGTGQTGQPAADIHQPDVNSGESGFSQELLSRARSYGIADAQVQSNFQSPEQLESALLEYDRQSLSQYQMWQQQQQWQQRQQQRPMQQQPQRPQQQQPPQQGQPQQPTPEENQAYTLKNPELYDEDLAADLNGMSGLHAQQYQQQQQELMQMRQVVEQQQQYLQRMAQAQQVEVQRRDSDAFDAQVQDLGPAWKEVFGEGSYGALPQNSPERANREKAYNTAQQIQWLHRQQGRNPTLKDVLPSSLQQNFPQRQAASQSQPRDQQGRYTARPTRRSNSAEASKRESALKKFDKYYAERGLPPDSMTGGDFDF